MEALWIVVSTVVWLLLAAMAGSMADERGQSPTLWFLIGLVLPLVAMLVLALAFERHAGIDTRDLTLADAARSNPVAKTLGDRPASSAQQLAEATSMRVKAVAGDLRTLRGAGLAERDASGRWSLTDEGDEALRDDEHAGTIET